MASEDSQRELEQAQKELTSELSKLTRTYSDLQDEVNNLTLYSDAVASEQAKIQEALALQAQGVTHLREEHRKTVSITGRLNSLAKQKEMQERMMIDQNKNVLAMIRERIKTEKEFEALADKMTAEYKNMQAADLAKAMKEAAEKQARETQEHELDIYNKEIELVQRKARREAEHEAAIDENEAKNRKQFDKFKSIIDMVLAFIPDLVENIYKTQRELGVAGGTALAQFAGAKIEGMKSLVSGGPILDTAEVIASTKAFKEEFGTILDTSAAARIASEAKLLGVTSDVYLKARRAFLTTGAEDSVRNKAIEQFRKAGLAGADALGFAAQNANLVAIAGNKYADSLFRAAAEAKKIAVNLSDIDRFSLKVAGNFEGTVADFSELAALGMQMNSNILMQVASTGTLEEKQKALREQLSQTGITGEELQRNSQLRLALTQAFGMDEATILRLAGVAQQPKEKTVEEQQLGMLVEVVQGLSSISRILGFISGVVLAWRYQSLISKPFEGIPIIGGLLGSLAAAAAGMGVSNLAGGLFPQEGFVAKSGGGVVYAADGYVSGPGTGTSDSIPAYLSNGETVVTAKATKMYGSDMLNAINKGTYSPSPSQVDMSGIEVSIKNLTSAIMNNSNKQINAPIIIEMDGYKVGYGTLNASSVLNTSTVIG